MQNAPTRGGAVLASLAMPWRYRTLILAVLPLLAVAGTVMTISGHPGPPLPFVLLWWAILGWNAYWFLLRLAVRVQLTPHTLRWQTALRNGEIPLSRVRRMRPHRFGGSKAQVIEVEGERPVLVWADAGVVQFGEQLRAVAPHVDVRIGWMTRWSDRLSG